jgi:hypothetical protein
MGDNGKGSPPGDLVGLAHARAWLQREAAKSTGRAPPLGHLVPESANPSKMLHVRQFGPVEAQNLQGFVPRRP